MNVCRAWHLPFLAFAAFAAFAVVAAAVSAIQGPAAAVLTGFLRSRTVMQVGPPAGREWNYKITMIIAEGSRVKAGDPVARFDGQDSLKNEQDAKNKLLQAKVDSQTAQQSLRADIETQADRVATQKKELALLEAGQIDEKAVGTVNMAWLISTREKLTADLEIASRKLRLKLEEERLVRKGALMDASLKSLGKLVTIYEAQLKQIEDEKADALQKAPADGVVLYLRNWRREKPKVGSAINRGAKALTIVDDTKLYVESYLKEEDFAAVKVGTKVDVRVLGSREISIPGTVSKISSVVMKVQDFEKSLPDTHALYDQRAFHVEVELAHPAPEAKPEGEVEVTVNHDAT